MKHIHSAVIAAKTLDAQSPTLGGSLMNDRIFNEFSIPTDCAKESASESPHIKVPTATRDLNLASLSVSLSRMSARLDKH